jgi:vancomycin resistance protein YoaR
MAYVKTVWVDRNVQYPNRYTDELANTKTFTPSPGTVTQLGTTVTATRMNNIETALELLDFTKRTTYQIMLSGWRF